jgi:hypothetical protein
VRRSIAAGLLSALLALGCVGSESARYQGALAASDPREAALAVFQAAQIGRGNYDDLQEVLRPTDSAKERAAVTDLLAGLRKTLRARVVALQAIDPARTAVDLEVDLPGGGVAQYSVQTAKEADGRWRVTAILGPEGAWPPAPAVAGEALSTSAP